MTKIRVRLGTRKNAKRWKKGQSSSSNPETKKYRNQARTWFLQQNQNSTGLTSEDLRKHDVLQGTASISEKIDTDDETMSGASSFKTFNTFASDYSKCSVQSFNRFLTHFQSNSVIHKEMLAVLTAVTDVIKEKDLPESETTYYGRLLEILKSAETDESVTATLSLLGMILKFVPKNVLKMKFSRASPIFLQVLTKYAMDENFLILRHCIGCIQILLRAQVNAWSDSSTLQVFNALMAFTIHTKPKVRRAAQHGVCAILKNSDIMKVDNPPNYHPAASEVAKHCMSQLESAGQPGHMKNTLHILNMLKEVFQQLPKSYIKSICEILLSIMKLNNEEATSSCLQTFHGLFVSKPNESVLPAKLNAQIINALYDYQPATSDTRPMLAWLTVMQEAFTNLASHSLDLCAANLPGFIEKITELWLSDKTEVLTGASHAIKHVLQECVTLICEDEQIASRYQTTLKKIIKSIHEGLKYQYTGAWHYVLHLLAVLFEIIGLNCTEDLTKILPNLADFRNTHKLVYNTEVDDAVGAAVKSLGPEIVLNAIPLEVSNSIWLLPVLKKNISSAPLSYFIKSLIPIAVRTDKISLTLQKQKDEIGERIYSSMRTDIWSLLPSFCDNPPDIKINFNSGFAKLLGDMMVNHKNLRSDVMASLRKLITVSVEKNNQEDVATLARFAGKYLHLLFNFYSTEPKGSLEESQRHAAFDTISLFLSITSKKQVEDCFNTAMQIIQDETKPKFEKESLFDLFRLFAQYVDIEKLKTLYDFCVPLLMRNDKQKEQKKAYRLLEEIFKSQSEICKQFISENRNTIQTLLKDSQEFVHEISKAARIRCIICLVESHPNIEKIESLQEFVMEALMCLKQGKKTCRTSSDQLLNTIAEKLKYNEEYFKEYIRLLISGLGGKPSVCSATFLAISTILYNYNGSLGIETIKEILDHACNLLTGPTREITASCLTFINIYLKVMPTPITGPTLSKIVESFSKMTKDCKHHCRLKIRYIFTKMIRKFGFDTISKIVPQSDTIMHKRLKNIRKVESRKQKTKQEKESKEEDSEEEFSDKRTPKSMEEILADSDEEFDDVDMEDDGGKNSKQRKTKAWIQESEDDIVDFTDPAVSKKILATKPGVSAVKQVKEKSKDCGFKTDEKGRLIIPAKTVNSKDKIDEEETNQKIILPFLGMSVDDDDDDDDREDDQDDAKSTKQTKKRKREGGSVCSETLSTSSKYKAGGSGIHRPTKVLKSKKEPGAEYRSSKAKGDMTYKGKQTPYAYLPLTRSSLNKRHKFKKNKKM